MAVTPYADSGSPRNGVSNLDVFNPQNQSRFSDFFRQRLPAGQYVEFSRERENFATDGTLISREVDRVRFGAEPSCCCKVAKAACTLLKYTAYAGIVAAIGWVIYCNRTYTAD